MRQKSAGEKSSEIDAVAESSNNQRVWERLPVEVKRTGNPEEVIVCVFFFLIGPVREEGTRDNAIH